MGPHLTFAQIRIAIFILLALFFVGLVTLVASGRGLFSNPEPEPTPSTTSLSTFPSISSTTTPIPIVSPSPLLPAITLDVPFLVQAPFAVWDALHEEACEEASLIMVKYFNEDKTISSREVGDKEIIDLINYQNQNGYAVDVTVEQLAEIAKNYYGMTTGRVENNITIEAIKEELAAGRPVIIPAAGKILPNPYFTGGGPDYHMLVIIGYDAEGFITNDPGTRRGQQFRYGYTDLLNAIHDWNDGKNILDGPKQYLVFD